MTHPTNPEPDVPNPEAAYGGADAVEKTTYVIGKGTDPEAQADGKTPPPVGKTGMNPLLWVVIVIAVVVAAVYVLAIFT